MAEPVDLSQFPPELIRAAIIKSAQEADAVNCFLDAFSQTPVGAWLANKPHNLPEDFLLTLGAALRLLMWEEAGIHVHQEAGLPPAHQALRDTFLAVTDPNVAATISKLPLQVFQIFVTQFAWTGYTDMGAEFILTDDPAEDRFVAAMAEFLWKNRHALQQENEQGQGDS